MAACCRIRRKHQPKRRKISVELVKHHTRLHPGAATLLINGEHTATMRAHIKNDGLVHALAVQASATAARQDGNALPCTPLHHANGFVNSTNNNSTQRINLERTRIRGIEHSPRAVSTNIRAANLRKPCNNAGPRCIGCANGV
jgi:hypothetical protein